MVALVCFVLDENPTSRMRALSICSSCGEEKKYLKKWRDPDDVSIDVERREEERKKQGLPQRVGILPHSAVAEEEKRWEAQQLQKKKRVP